MAGALWAAMNEFSNNSCEVTHTECLANESGEIQCLVICGILFADDEKGQRKLYAEFADFLRANAVKLPKLPFTAYLGFNYDKPGMITIRQDEIKYDPDKDIIEEAPVCMDSLSGVMGFHRHVKYSDEGGEAWRRKRKVKEA